MKPRKVKEDDAPRTIACPHKVSLISFSQKKHATIFKILLFCVIEHVSKVYSKAKKSTRVIDFHAITVLLEQFLQLLFAQ